MIFEPGSIFCDLLSFIFFRYCNDSLLRHSVSFSPNTTMTPYCFILTGLLCGFTGPLMQLSNHTRLTRAPITVNASSLSHMPATPNPTYAYIPSIPSFWPPFLPSAYFILLLISCRSKTDISSSSRLSISHTVV